MLNKKLLLSAFFCASVFSFSQGRRNGQNSIHLEGGLTPTFENKFGGEYMIKGGYSRIIGDKGLMIKGEAFYHDYSVKYIDNQFLPYQKFGVGVNVGYSYEELYPVFFNAWFGGYGGYENVNNGSQIEKLYNSKISEQVNNFIYGINGSIEIEINVTKKVSFITNYTQYYDLKSKFSKSNYGVFGGLKLRLN